MAKHCLIISPIPSHPQFQGNSARIYRFGRSLQALGYQVHFLYYPLEGLTPEQRHAMSLDWDYFYSLPCDLPSGGKMSRGDHYGIDDWYDSRAGDLAVELHAKWRYEFVLVNYVWFSGVLDALPQNLVKIIDTHDVFGDRHKRSIAAGMPPEWFYTTIEEERRGLSRANIVIAIQDEEREYYRSLKLSCVVETIGFITPLRRVARQSRERITFGYLASSNPWNVNGFKQLVEELARHPDIARQANFILAGPVCEKVKDKPGPFRLLGIVDSVDEFYGQVDIALNPMLGGTGLKIKTVEALSFGAGVISTIDGFVGIESPYEEHQLNSMAKFVACLKQMLATGPSSLNEIRRKSAVVFSQYQFEQVHALKYTCSNPEVFARRAPFERDRALLPSDRGSSTAPPKEVKHVIWAEAFKA